MGEFAGEPVEDVADELVMEVSDRENAVLRRLHYMKVRPAFRQTGQKNPTERIVDQVWWFTKERTKKRRVREWTRRWFFLEIELPVTAPSNLKRSRASSTQVSYPADSGSEERMLLDQPSVKLRHQLRHR